MCACDRIDIDMVRTFDIAKFPAIGFEQFYQFATIHDVYYTHLKIKVQRPCEANP